VGSVESFVFSLNKRRKRKHLQNPHLPEECRAGPPALAEEHVLLLWSPALAQWGLGTSSLGMLVLVRERNILGSELCQVLGLFSQEYNPRTKGKFHSWAV
jgi:hypothetical protein